MPKIKILHIDSNHAILKEQLEILGFVNDEDFTSSKEIIEGKLIKWWYST